MNIEKNKVVALTYELTVEGKVADKATEDAPLDYIHGNHMLLPKFEAELEGKKPGDEFAFTLSPEEGYGVHDPKLRFDIPKSTFEVNGMLREDLLVVGAVIPLLNSSGQVIQAQIMEVKEDAVNMDFNHPMAGKTLDFKGKIVNVREATPEELRNGLHGEYLPQDDCGCGCDHHHHGDDCKHDDGDCGCGHCHH